MKTRIIKSRIGKACAAIVLAAAAALASAPTAQAVTIGYSSVPGGAINFSGGSFSFSPAVDSLQIDTGSASGLFGEITGNYTIGAVTITGPVQTAPVTGSGTFVIHDGLNDFTADLTWGNIGTLFIFGALNTQASLNLTNITYAGANADLLALANADPAAATLSFTFIPAKTVTELKSGNHSTTFSGTLASVPDGGSTLALLGLGLIGTGVLRKKLRAV